MDSDPFSRETLWSFNYIFINRTAKRVLFFAVLAKRHQLAGEGGMSGGDVVGADSSTGRSAGSSAPPGPSPSFSTLPMGGALRSLVGDSGYMTNVDDGAGCDEGEDGEEEGKFVNNMVGGPPSSDEEGGEEEEEDEQEEVVEISLRRVRKRAKRISPPSPTNVTALVAGARSPQPRMNFAFRD